MKIFTTTLLISLFSIFAYSQVGINTESPESTAALDINSRTGSSQGVLLPRMTTVDKLAIVNPANSLLVYDTDLRCVSQNIGLSAQPAQWICLTQSETRFFYMPSIVINTTTPGTYSLSLYTRYQSQFSSPQVKSTGAPNEIPFFPSPYDLYYYVAYYDSSVLNITSINDDGTMNYEVLATPVVRSFMNVVFVVK